MISAQLKAGAQGGFGQTFGNGFGQSLQQGFGQPSNNALDNPVLQKLAPKYLDKERTLEDFFPKTETTFVNVTPYDMTGLKVTGLETKYSPVLGQNRLLVVENTPYSSMSDIYRENRLNGKSNFVTADCIVHAYFALHNSILRDVICEKTMPELLLMLQSMLKESSIDYKDADDAEVKNDIAKNIAYIAVALRLLEPTLKVSISGTTSQLVDDEMKNIAAGKKAKSAIFGNDEDYALFRPRGFYDREAKLRNFYRCRQWASRIEFPLTDSDLSEKPTEGKPESRFRQSVLLFRSLDKATINGAAAMSYWKKFDRVWQMMGADENAREHPLLPPDYKTVFSASGLNLSNLLQGLSEPFFRTKLLLSIRRNKPLELGSTSILTVKKKENAPAEHAIFRLLPIADEPELPWLAEVAQNFSEERGVNEATPFSLLELYGRGSTLATNILANICDKLDGDLFKTLPKLIEDTSRKRAVAPAAFDAGSQDGRWTILTNYFKPMPESSQNVLKTETWMRRRLLSAFAGWVDSHVALLATAKSTGAAAKTDAGSVLVATYSATTKGAAPSTTPASSTTTNGASAATKTAAIASTTTPPIASTTTASKTATATATTTATAKSSTRSSQTPALTTAAATASSGTETDSPTPKAAVSNYLEPAPNLFKSVRLKLQQMVDDLASIDYLPAQKKQSAQDLISLCQKLEEISRKEVTNNFVSAQDSRFLGDIDQVLDNFPAPTQGVFHIDSDSITDKSGKITSGANLCIGKPGIIFMLLRLGRKETLCRGAVYTYYEVAGGPLKPEHWDRKLQYTMSLPPRWTADFEVQQATAQ